MSTNYKKINAADLLNTESEILKRIASEVLEGETNEFVSGHYSGHKQSSGHHTQHNSAIREKINTNDKK